jgi:acetyl-CoA carboxylase biotin carboxyl carrier protein
VEEPADRLVSGFFLNVGRDPRRAGPAVHEWRSGGEAGTVPVMSTVKARQPGVFYRRPAPEADPYVREGGHVDAGQTIAVIEAVKTYNPVKAETSGTVTRFLLDDGAEVTAGQDVVEVVDETT